MENLMRCDKCPRVFATEGGLKKHRKRHELLKMNLVITENAKIVYRIVTLLKEINSCVIKLDSQLPANPF